MDTKLSIIWKHHPGHGSVTLINAGKLAKMSSGGQEILCSPSFSLAGQNRLELEIEGAAMDIGPFATVVNIRTGKNPFSFFARDVSAAFPIYIPQYGVVVTTATDGRLFEEIVEEIRSGGRQSRLEAIGSQPEEAFETASKVVRNMKCPTWLGVTRDIRNFEVDFHGMAAVSDTWDCIRPKDAGMDARIPEIPDKPVKYDYFCGRGHGCVLDRSRRLENGVIPILDASLIDEEIHYEYKIFATLEKSRLTAANIRGTHYLVAEQYMHGSMQTAEQSKIRDGLHDREFAGDEETVCYVRVQAINTGLAPKYSFVRLPQPNVYLAPYMYKVPVRYDPLTGFGSYSEDRVFLIATLNGKPVPAIETTVLLAPGEKAEYVFKIPHRPLEKVRAEALARLPYHEKLDECVSFWSGKLQNMARIALPERRIEEMMKAGMLHCDLITYGREPDGPLAASIGVYNPIGSESSPIIQYLDSVGLHDIARRAIMFFVEKQHDDGFMQNFGGYMLETGCVLWTIGEHWRYTRDDAWIRSIRENIVKAVDYIAAWRERNKRDELKGRGYGMIDGKVADPEDVYHIYMLNSTAYIGVKRAAEVLAAIGDSRSERVRAEAEDFLACIQASVAETFAEAPAMPLGSGAWCPSVPVWAENPGPVCLQTTGGEWFSHGTFCVRDSMLSAPYMLLDEVIDPASTQGDFILQCLTDNFNVNNTAFSQPYYSPHPLANLRRGEVKAFLKEFYSCMAALADRETYTFWEHFFYASPHKTHEEGWFLMRCRWMLYLENGDTLQVLPGVPRAWLENGKAISVEGAASYFGKLSFTIRSNVSLDQMSVHVQVDGPADRLPAKVAVRLPHPLGLKAKSVSAGRYDAACETLILEGFTGEADVAVIF
jgi:hypothetical protein